MTKKPTAVEDILYWLNNIQTKQIEANRWMAVHEFPIFGHSQTSISARLRELRRIGAVQCRVRDGFAYKEWALAESVKQEAANCHAGLSGMAQER